MVLSRCYTCHAISCLSRPATAVLSDPQQRAIYDLYGEQGVEAGHELAPYYNTVAEVCLV